MGTNVMRRGSLWIAVLAILAGLLAGPAAPQDSLQRQQPGPAKVAPKKPPGAAQQVTGQVAKAEEEQAREARDAKEREERAALERRLAEATAALANLAAGVTYATIGLIVVAASLWLLAYLQSRDIRAAVRAAQESSAAARQSADVAQRGLVLTQRATVIVGEPKAVWLRDGSERLVGCRLLVTWQNVGTTPTKDMTAAVAGLAVEKPPARNGVFPEAKARLEPAIVGPNAAINSSHINLPIGLVADILRHRRYYLFGGWAEYNDVFEHTPRHRVEFCYWLEFEGELDAQRLQARFHIHGKHNRHCDSQADARRPGDGDARAQHIEVREAAGASVN